MILTTTAKVVKAMIFIEITLEMLTEFGDRARQLADYLEQVDNTLQ